MFDKTLRCSLARPLQSDGELDRQGENDKVEQFRRYM